MLPESNLNDLLNLINTIKTYPSYDEANTKSNIITPILRALNWNVHSPFEVVREYPLEGGRVDYALKVVDDIKVLIEAKRMSEHLNNSVNQIRKYAIDKNIYLFVLSNGIRWQFFTWSKKGIRIFKFYDLDLHIHDANYIAHELIKILSKESIRFDKSYNYIRTLIAQDPFKFALYDAIIEVWHNMFEQPSQLLCNLIIDEVNKSFGISAQSKDVEKILNDYKHEFKKIRDLLSGEDEIKYRYGHKLRKDIERIKKSILSFYEKKKGLVPIREISMRLHRTTSPKELDEGITQLCSIGFCELVGRKIKLIKPKAGD